MREAPEKMTVDSLECRIRFHESTAAMYRDRGELGMSRKFLDLAASYQRELERRIAGRA